MTSAPSDAPANAPSARGVAPGGTDARRRVAVAVGAALLVLLAVGVGLVRLAGPGADRGPVPCEILTDRRGLRPPASVLDGAALLHEAARSSGAEVRTVCHVPLPLDGEPRTDASDAAAWSVDGDVVVDDVADLAGAAAAVLAVASPQAPFTWSLDVQDAAGAVSVALEPGGDVTRVDVAVAMGAVEGVSEVWLGPDGGRVTTLAAGLAPVLAVADGHDLPLTAVVASFPWVEVQQVRPGEWPAAEVVALATDVAGWEGVARTVVRDGSPADLTVDVEDVEVRAEVAQRMADLGDVGHPVAYHANALGEAVDGVLGAPDGASDAALPAAPGGAVGAQVRGAHRGRGVEGQ